MNKKKTIAVAAVLALIILIGGTLALFTDKTVTKTNVFTVGNVDIALTEPSWDPSAPAVIASEQILDKDPTITNNGVADAYVFALVKVPTATINSVQNTELFEAPVLNDGWREITPLPASITATNGYATHLYAYATSSEMTALTAAASTTVFDEVQLITLANADYANLPDSDNETAGKQFNIDVVAYGIQTGMADSNGAEVKSPTAVWELVKDATAGQD